MISFDALLQSGFIQALGWTLVHAIWQVAAVALLLMLALPGLRKSSASIRYRVSLGALVVVAILSGITFLTYYLRFSGGGQVSGDIVNSSAIAAEASLPGFFPGVTGFFYRNLFTLVTLWAAGVIVLSLRFAGGIWYLHNLRSKAVSVGGNWAKKVSLMAGQSGIRRAVRLAESAVVRAPMMIGHLKPLILVPAGMLAAIPAEQVEAILAHELGHIRRNDFLVNLLQSLAEIIYFFHPGIWWISSVIRRERELCCDDAATQQGCNPVTLAFALSEVGEWTYSNSNGNGKLALAFAGRGEQPLLTRIKRLLGQEPSNPLSMLPAAVLVTTLILFLLLAGSDRVFSSSAEEDGDPVSISEESGFSIDKTRLDTLPEPRGGRNTEVRRGEEVKVEVESRQDQNVNQNKNLESPAAPVLKLSPIPKLDELPPVPVAPQMDFSEMPTLDIPPAPPADAVPPVPPVPPVMDSASWEQFGLNMKDLGENVAGWVQNFISGSDTTKFPGVQFNFDEESMKDFEKSMEDFGERMEEWGEKYGEKMEAWAKTNEPKIKEFELKMKVWEKENKPKMEEYERKMKEWEKGNKPKMEQYERKMKEWEKENQPKLEKYQREVEEHQRKIEERQREIEKSQEENESHLQNEEQKG